MSTAETTTPTTTAMTQDTLASQKRQAEIDKRQAQFDEWTAQIEKLRAKVNQADADVRRQSYEQLQNLMAARDAVSDQLVRLRDAGQDTWTDILRQTDEAFQSFSSRFHSFVKDQS